MQTVVGGSVRRCLVTLWKPEAMRITRGAENIGVYNKTTRSDRKFCKTCGGHLFTHHPHWNSTDVYAAVIPGLKFKPGVHVNYQDTVLAADERRPAEDEGLSGRTGRIGHEPSRVIG